MAGYFVEYTGIRFAMFFIAEYANMFLMSMLVTVLYLGGWHGFTIPGLEGVSGVVWTLAKALTLMFGYFWLRATLPRLRYDQLMAFCWKILLPLGVLNLFRGGRPAIGLELGMPLGTGMLAGLRRILEIGARKPVTHMYPEEPRPRSRSGSGAGWGCGGTSGRGSRPVWAVGCARTGVPE